MAKVKFPLLSGGVSGKFGNQMIYRRGGVVTRMFRPRNPRSAAQEAHRLAFKEFYMAGLTQAQADLLYSAILHSHDDLYSLLGHGHDHGDLSGLGDDDHTQYYNETRGDARYLRSGVSLTWTNATLQNAWVQFGSPYASAGYSKDVLGFVHLRGGIKSGVSSTVAFTLPTGYRPPYRLYSPMVYNGAISYCLVDTNGVVTPTASDTSLILFDGISFPV